MAVKFSDHIVAPAAHGSLPAANSVGVGSLFSCTTHTKVYRSNGTAWVDYLTSATAVMPTGTIVLWSGTVATIPLGWVLCNGTNGTPNLVDHFVTAGDAGTAGTSGGSLSPTVTPTAHTMGGITATATATTSAAGALAGSTAPTHTHPAPTITAHATPKWFALAYIMKT